MAKKKVIETSETVTPEMVNETIALLDLADLKNFGRADLNMLVDRVESKVNEIIKKVNQ